MREAGTRFVEFERGVLLDASVGQIDTDSLERLHANHDDLVRSLNTVQWDVPGSNQLQEDASRLRHAFLAQAEFYELSVFPNLSVSTPLSP